MGGRVIYAGNYYTTNPPPPPVGTYVYIYCTVYMLRTKHKEHVIAGGYRQKKWQSRHCCLGDGID